MERWVCRTLRAQAGGQAAGEWEVIEIASVRMRMRESPVVRSGQGLISPLDCIFFSEWRFGRCAHWGVGLQRDVRAKACCKLLLQNEDVSERGRWGVESICIW